MTTPTTTAWSIEEWCQNQKDEILHNKSDDESFVVSSVSIRLFFKHLDLPFRHPFCDLFLPRLDPNSSSSLSSYELEGVPPQGPIPTHELLHKYTMETYFDAWITMYKMIMPSILGMMELWFRLLASIVAPCGTLILLFVVYYYFWSSSSSWSWPWPWQEEDRNNPLLRRRRRRWILPYLSLLWTVISSIILMTDTLYVLEYGNTYGMSLFIASFTLGWQMISSSSSGDLKEDNSQSTSSVAMTTSNPLRRRKNVGAMMTTTTTTRFGWILCALIAMAISCNDSNSGGLVWGDTKEEHAMMILPGLYYDPKHQQDLINHWNVPSYTTYQKSATSSDSEQSSTATPWMPTGDARTGLPFLMNSVPDPKYTRVWVTMDHDQEVVALDIAFGRGFHIDQPVFFVLHGLNGGSREEYVKDFVHRCNANNSTVIVMVARGLMDLPIRGFHIFHGARWDDAHQAATKIKQGLVSYATSVSSSPVQPLLIGVGYSMGAIILSNMVARTGSECALDAAVAISGGLDMRAQIDNHRAQRLWQPMLCQELRDAFVLGKWGYRVQSRLTKEQMKQLMRATHVTEIDQTAVVAYHGFRDLIHYYTEMSALGDVPLEELLHVGSTIHPSRRIHNISVPLVVLHSMDDPIISWRTVAATTGPMHPSNLTRNTGNGNLMILLTKAGGHVGFPTGWLPFVDKWKWMSEVPIGFAKAMVDLQKTRTIVSKNN